MKDVSINGHLRDMPDGSIVLNIDYLDFYEKERPLTQFEKECLEDPDGGCDDLVAACVVIKRPMQLMSLKGSA